MPLIISFHNSFSAEACALFPITYAGKHIGLLETTPYNVAKYLLLTTLSHTGISDIFLVTGAIFTGTMIDTVWLGCWVHG